MNGVEIVLHASLAVMLAAVVNRALARMPAATRAAVWTAAIIGILLLPAFRWMLPQGALGGVLDLGSLLPAAEVPANGLLGPPPSGAGPESLAQSWPLILLVGWGAGAFLLLARLLIGIHRLSDAARRAVPVHDRMVLEEFQEISADLAIRRRIDLRWTDELDSPVTFGLRQPVVLLPAGSHAWPPAQRRSVLIHELAHVQRFDALALLCASVVACLHWFNPLVHLAVRRMRTEQENACDDQVLRAGVQPSEFVDHLIASVRWARTAGRAGPGAFPLVAQSMLGGTDLRSRTAALLAPERTLRVRRRSGAVLAGATFVALLVPMTAFVAAAPSQPTPTPVERPLPHILPLMLPASAQDLSTPSGQPGTDPQPATPGARPPDDLRPARLPFRISSSDPGTEVPASNHGTVTDGARIPSPP